MPKFIIKATETVTMRHDVEADTLAEAIAMVEEGESEAMDEVDSTAQTAIEYMRVGLHMGWTPVTAADRGDAPTYSVTVLLTFDPTRCDDVTPDQYDFETDLGAMMDHAQSRYNLADWDILT